MKQWGGAVIECHGNTCNISIFKSPFQFVEDVLTNILLTKANTPIAVLEKQVPDFLEDRFCLVWFYGIYINKKLCMFKVFIAL
jgi:hypothetical protein